MKTTLTQHIVATALMALVIFLLCFMFGEPRDTESAGTFLRLMSGLACFAVLHPVCRALYRNGYLPQIEDEYNDNF